MKMERKWNKKWNFLRKMKRKWNSNQRKMEKAVSSITALSHIHVRLKDG